MLLLLLALASGPPPVASDTLAFTITFRPSGDSAAPVLARLSLPPGHEVLTLALPSAWAGRTKLYENIIELHAVDGRRCPTNEKFRDI